MNYLWDKIFNVWVPIYDQVRNRGILHFKDTVIHKLQISVADIQKNTSQLTILVKNTNHTDSAAVKPDTYEQIMPYQKANNFQRPDINISFPKYTFYDTVRFTYKRSPKIPQSESLIYHLHNRFTPVHKRYSLQIKPPIPKYLYDKAVIAYVHKDSTLEYVGGRQTRSYISAHPRKLGKFVIALDTIPPEITPVNISNKANMKHAEQIKLQITDNLSGIKEYNGYIDGKWALFAYDQKNDRVSYRFDKKRISFNTTHHLRFVVTDQKGNKSTYEADFFK